MFGRILVTALVLLAATSAYAQPKGKTLNVPLAWTPKEAMSPPVIDLTGGLRALRIDALVDARESKDAIGENPEKKPLVSVVTSSDVAKFVADNVTREIKQLGLEVSAGATDRVLSGELLQFWVNDAGSYDATVRIKFTMRDGDGKELWTGVVTGKGENWGRQLKPINYTEAITAALLDLVANVVKAPEFMRTLKMSGA